MDINQLEMQVLNKSTARDFIVANHYTGSCPKISLALGFYYGDQLVAAIVYGQPSGKHLASCIWENGSERECFELLRLFSYDFCPRNTESHCISESFRYLKQYHPEIKVLVAYADANYDHIGYIYQATNWIYTGIGSNERSLFIDGKRVHRRDLYDKFGTSSLKYLKNTYGDRFTYTERLPKYRYVYILRNRKPIFKKMKLPNLPYPKMQKEN